jgi:hypothetical protein
VYYFRVLQVNNYHVSCLLIYKFIDVKGAEEVTTTVSTTTTITTTTKPLQITPIVIFNTTPIPTTNGKTYILYLILKL